MYRNRESYFCSDYQKKILKNPKKNFSPILKLCRSVLMGPFAICFARCKSCKKVSFKKDMMQDKRQWIMQDKQDISLEKLGKKVWKLAVQEFDSSFAFFVALNWQQKWV